MNFTEFRLKLRYFVRKNRKIIYIAIILWSSIFLLDKIFGAMPVDYTPQTTYEAHTSVMDESSSTPQSVQKTIEDKINTYLEACNEGNYQKAFDMLSDDCKEYEYENNVEEFMKYVIAKMPLKKKYFIQDYSNINCNNRKLYIYEVRYTDDYLATGLTNSVYGFTSEKMAFYKDKDGQFQMNTGSYIYHTDIKSISENEYLKIDVIDKTVNYETEEYNVKFTNRSNYTVVVADNQEGNEVLLTLPNETRTRDILTDIILEPNASMNVTFKFPKFVDDGDSSNSLLFPAIRVMEDYTYPDFADEETIQYQIDNAISKFSMEVALAE